MLHSLGNEKQHVQQSRCHTCIVQGLSNCVEEPSSENLVHQHCKITDIFENYLNFHKVAYGALIKRMQHPVRASAFNLVKMAVQVGSQVNQVKFEIAEMKSDLTEFKTSGGVSGFEFS